MQLKTYSISCYNCAIDALYIGFANFNVTGGGWFGFQSKQGLILNNASFIDSKSSCCYAAGYGYNLLSNATTTCQDTDTGDTYTMHTLIHAQYYHYATTTDATTTDTIHRTM
jgi:hypothetical protein